MEYKEWRYGIPEDEDEDNEDKTSPATAPTPIDYSLPPPSYDEISWNLAYGQKRIKKTETISKYKSDLFPPKKIQTFFTDIFKKMKD